MAGLSGSGKSTTARQLMAQAGAIRLRSDAVRKHLFGLSIHEKGGDELYKPAMSDRTYSRLIELGVKLAKCGYRVILDAKFDRAAKRQEAMTSAQAVGIPIAFLHCTAPEEVLKSRVQQRSGDITDATVAVLAQQFMEPFSANAQVITLDTTQPPDAIQQQLVSVFSDR